MKVILTAVAEFLLWMVATGLVVAIICYIGRIKNKRDLQKCQSIGNHTGNHIWELAPDNYYDREEMCSICGKRRTY